MNRVVVGDVEVRVDSLSFDQVLELLNVMGGIALALGEKQGDDDDEEPAAVPASGADGPDPGHRDPANADPTR